MKKLSLVLTLVFFAIGISMAQRTVTGTVADNTGETLIGASVLVKGTTTGTVTDFDGKYSLSVPEGAKIIVFSYTGFETQELELGTSNVLDIVLAEGVTLNAAVVTALGIKREKKSLGYATQTVGGEEVTKAKDANFINSLSGKVAGVDIKRSTQLGGSSNVVIRGAKSLTSSNQALFVVDGTPISNAITNTTNQQTGRGGYDYGNAAMDINPEDVESVSILRGAAATALYGSRAANGVILITTKKGTKQKALGVSISSGITAGVMDKSTFVRYQNQYGAGYSSIQGWYASGAEGDPNPDGFDYFDFGNGDVLSEAVYEDASFGPEFDPSLQVYTWQSYYPELSTYGQTQPYTGSDNDATTFYETALTYNNSISIDGGTDKSQYRLSYTNFDMKGNLPNSSLKKNTVAFSGGYDITDKLKASSSINFVNQNAVGRYGTGYDNRNPNQSFRQWYQVSTDFVEQEDAYMQTGKNISWNPYGPLDPGRATAPHYFDNYYFNRFENFQNDERNRIIGNASLNYELNSWFSIMGRVSMDRYNDIQEERIADGSIDVPMYLRRNRDFSEMNYDLIASFNKYFGADNKINFDGNLGMNIRRTTWNNISASTNGGLVVPGIYSLSNSINPIAAPSEYAAQVGTNGYFARASIGYDNFLYVDLAGRYDVSSTLPTDNNAYFYPSASLSLIFSELINTSVLSFGKLRFNYAEVGSDAPALAIKNTFNFVSPFMGTALASASSTEKNANLLPENTKSIEAGMELNFLNNRIGLDFSVYRSNTFNQIIPVSVTGATGSLRKFVNAGNIQNEGLELAINTTPVKAGDFRWNLNLTWSKNRNEVIELFEDQTNLRLTGVQGGVSINATVGEAYGSLWGTNFVDHTNGEHIVYPHWGGGMRYRKTSSPEVIGNVNPDWRGGILNSLSYKSLAFSFLIDIQKGGDFFSLDTWYGTATGIYDFSAGDNDKGNPVRSNPDDGGGLPIDGVVHQTDADGNYMYDSDGNPTSDGTANTDYGYASDVYTSFGYVYAPNALHVHDATYVKLREVVLTYSLPSNLFENNFIGGIDLSLIGRNLWIIHKNSEYSDPEAGLSAGSYLGNQSGAYPAVKEVGFNLKVRF
jgi:TonB-linked SusC/RagA family outer membrane protein